MEMSNMKNIVMLRNLPSNIVEEAIVILKANQKIKKLELVEQNKTFNNNIKEVDNKEYILKEAEMLVSNYINELENSKIKKSSSNLLEKKYHKLKKYSIAITIGLFVSLIMNFV